MGAIIMITVVCWKWHQPNYRSKFTAEHVNVLEQMVAKHLQLPHKFVCITDDPDGIDCETIPLWNEPRVHLPEGRPNCYRRLKAFAPDAAEWLGERILSIDLDTVIVDDITPLVDRHDDFVIWGDTARNTHYNGGFWLLRAGSRSQVWTEFTPDAPRLTRNMVGSDQAWISYVLGKGQPKWSEVDGVYSYRNHLREGTLPLPSNARIVFMHGKFDPWDELAQERSPWIQKHWFGQMIENKKKKHARMLKLNTIEHSKQTVEALPEPKNIIVPPPDSNRRADPASKQTISEPKQPPAEPADHAVMLRSRRLESRTRYLEQIRQRQLNVK
jgi:hypothetical protein